MGLAWPSPVLPPMPLYPSTGFHGLASPSVYPPAPARRHPIMCLPWTHSHRHTYTGTHIQAHGHTIPLGVSGFLAGRGFYCVCPACHPPAPRAILPQLPALASFLACLWLYALGGALPFLPYHVPYPFLGGMFPAPRW